MSENPWNEGPPAAVEVGMEIEVTMEIWSREGREQRLYTELVGDVSLEAFTPGGVCGGACEGLDHSSRGREAIIRWRWWSHEESA